MPNSRHVSVEIPVIDSGEFLVPEASFHQAVTHDAELRRYIQKLRETLAMVANKLHTHHHNSVEAGDRGWQHCRYATCRQAAQTVFG